MGVIYQDPERLSCLYWFEPARDESRGINPRGYRFCAYAKAEAAGNACEYIRDIMSPGQTRIHLE